MASKQAVWDSGATVSTFREIFETEPLLYKPWSTDVVKLVTHGAKARCLGKGALRLRPQLLKESVRVKDLNTTLLYV